MARRSAKSTPASTARSSSKRAAADGLTPTRQSKRNKAAPAKQSYVEPESDGDENDSTPSPEEESDTRSASDFEDEGDKDSTSEPASEPTESDDGTAPKKTARRSRSAGNAKKMTIPIHKKQASEKELWKPGSKLEVGTQVIIKKPKAREAGDTPYEDHTIHPNTMLFLKDLAVNNDRQWLKMHDPDYRAALQDFTTFLETLTEKVVELDETVPELPVKDIIFRIYRDVRFSKDQTPYKTHFSAAWSRTGRKGPYAAYYVQLKPDGGSFVGGGLWQPEAQPLSLLRRDIDRYPHKIKRVLNDARLRKSFFGGIGNDEKKAVKAFTSQHENKATALKKHPKGYDKDHKDIELLRLRSFTLGARLPDREVVGAGGLERIAELVGCMVPFITYLNSVVMPDEESSESADSSSDEGEDEGNDDDNDEGN